MLEIIFIAISLSIDALTISIANSINNTKKNILFISIIFSIFQGLMPCLGLILGSIIYNKISSYISIFTFIIFFYLTIVSFKSIGKQDERIISNNYELIISAIITSIDAFSIGLILTNKDYLYIISLIVFIILITFLLCYFLSIYSKRIKDIDKLKLISFIILYSLMVKYFLLLF